MPTKHLSLKILIIFLLHTIISNDVQAAQIIRKNFFSYVTQCKNESPKLLDFIESSLLRSQSVSPFILTAKTEEEILENLTKSLDKFGPLRNKEFQENYLDLKKKILISEAIKITPPAESDHLLIPEDCDLIPVATLIQNIDPYTSRVDNRVLVDKKIWDQLKLYEQFAIVMDFAMMKDYDQTNLIGSRIFMGYWFSDSFNSLSDKTWMDLITYLEFPYFEYQNYKLHLKDRFYHENGMLSRLDFYKKNTVVIHDQALQATGYAWVSRTGKILELSQTSSYFQTTPGGDKIEVFASGDQKLVFQDNEKQSLRAGTITSNDKDLSYYKHTLKLSKNSLVSVATFFESGNIEKMKFLSGEVKIRGKIYQLSGSPPDASYTYIGDISFFDNGEIQCADSF